MTMCVYNVSLSFSIYSSMAKNMNYEQAECHAKQQTKKTTYKIQYKSNRLERKQNLYTTRKKRYFNGVEAEVLCRRPIFWYALSVLYEEQTQNRRQGETNLIWNRKHIANIIKIQTRSLTLLKHQLLTFHTDKYRLGLGSCKQPTVTTILRTHSHFSLDFYLLFLGAFALLCAHCFVALQFHPPQPIFI